jgi:hypothetical protein
MEEENARTSRIIFNPGKVLIGAGFKEQPRFDKLIH